MKSRKQLFFKSIILIIFCSLCSFSYSQNNRHLTKQSQKIHEEFWQADSLIYGYLMPGTKYQTPVFHFRGKKDGAKVLIIGGTHGNEPAGFEAAHRLLKQFQSTQLSKGQIFIIPEANKIADHNNERRIPVPDSLDRELGNLNRCYPGNANGLPMEQAAYEITQLITKQKISLLLDLHESRFFHLESRNKEGEYLGLGQTLIYTVNEKAVWLAMVAADHLNSKISIGLKKFTLLEQPIKSSAAWSAGENFNIPGFTVETCRKLPLEERIGYQLDVVNAMLHEQGVTGIAGSTTK